MFLFEYCKIFKKNFFFQFERKFVKNEIMIILRQSLQFALRQPEKKNVWEFLYFYVDKTVDNKQTVSETSDGKVCLLRVKSLVR